MSRETMALGLLPETGYIPACPHQQLPLGKAGRGKVSTQGEIQGEASNSDNIE